MSPIVEPFLQLSGAADLERREPRACGAPRLPQIVINLQQARRLRSIGEQLSQDFLIHRRADHQRSPERMRVLWRQRWRGHQPVMRGLFNERVEEELRCALEDRVNGAEIRAIAGVLIAIPQCDREPCTASRPHSPLWAVDGCRRAPQIGVVMRDPSARAVHLSRGARAGHRQIRHHRRQRIHRLCQIRGQRRPVVHLGVDVDGVLAAPWWRHAVVPYALQVRRLRTRSESWR
jgi:hypothetical protein